MRALTFALMLTSPSLLAGPVVIGHPGTPPMDATALQRIYTGKVVELNGMRVTPVNLPPGNPLRLQFLQRYLAQDDAKYIGYWTVRRYVGKGTPPKELETTQAILDFVARTKGAIGYVDQREATDKVEVLLKTSP